MMHFENLAVMASDKKSGVVLERKIIHVALMPQQQLDINGNILKHFNSHKHMFYPDLGGILIDYDRVHVRTRDLAQSPRWPFLLLPTEADFFLFYPKKGLRLECRVTKKEGKFLLECLFIETFRVEVSEPAGADKWIGDRVKVEVISVTYRNYCPVMQGRLVEGGKKIKVIKYVEEFHRNICEDDGGFESPCGKRKREAYEHDLEVDNVEKEFEDIDENDAEENTDMKAVSGNATVKKGLNNLEVDNDNDKKNSVDQIKEKKFDNDIMVNTDLDGTDINVNVETDAEAIDDEDEMEAYNDSSDYRPETNSNEKEMEFVESTTNQDWIGDPTLPEGWKRRPLIEHSNLSKGDVGMQVTKYQYLSPDELVFDSRKEVLEYLDIYTHIPNEDQASQLSMDYQQEGGLEKCLPNRRSEIKQKNEKLKERMEGIKAILLATDDSELGLKVFTIPEKGRGVVSTRDLKKDDVLVEYAGDIIKLAAAKERDLKYSDDASKGPYMYFFKYKEKTMCVDATFESGRLGRLLNHSCLEPNVVAKVVELEGDPRLILVANQDISAGIELLFDYGERRKAILEDHPWLTS